MMRKFGTPIEPDYLIIAGLPKRPFSEGRPARACGGRITVSTG